MHPSFGRYELLKRLAGGGMGEVFLARQRGLDGFQKLLVIKTLLPHLCDDDEFIAMFKDEARVSAQLIHPNICQVFEFDQVNDTYYMAMEYLRGEDLRRLWKACETRGTPLRVPLICRVIADAAAGLDFAHSLRNSAGEPYNIVHRDISPQNILVTFEGGVKIIDFGVAKAAGRAQHTRTGALKGKYSYMSPEQVAGGEIDGRSDIFALGIVLHELLTGRRLFKADSDVQTLARVREAHVLPPSRLNPQLPPGLDELVLKALAKDPADRFRTAQEFRLALEDWLIGGRMSASSAHLAEFLKVVYAERLDKESRLGPLMGDVGLAAPPGTATPSGNSPASSIELKGPAPMHTPPAVEPTVKHRTPAAAGGATASTVDPSMARTLSGAPSFKDKRSLRLALAAGGALIVAAALVVLRPQARPAEGKPGQPAAPQEAELTLVTEPEAATVTIDGAPSGKRLQHAPGPVRIEVAADGYQTQVFNETLAAGPQTRKVTLPRQAPQSFMVRVEIEPTGTEIYEGSRLIGKSPAFWTGASRGEHELTFQLAGYHEASGKVTVVKDGQEFTFKPLRKVETRARPSVDLAGIKEER
jgi:serine/threonine protein kinase